MSTLHDVAALDLGGPGTALSATRPQAPVPSVAVTPMQMLAMAIDRGADVAMLERLMTLQERWEANEARKAFVAALSAFKADPPTVTKNKTVNYGEGSRKTVYDHATLDQVASVIGAALSKHGLSHRWETEQMDGGMIRVTCILQHQGGHSERVTLQATPDTSGSKNHIQAVGSTVTYLQRYTLLAATGLAAKDQDDDTGGMTASTMISDAEKAELVDLLRETGADVKRFLTHFRVENIDQLPLARFGEAKAALERKRKAKEAAQ